jgi:pimeloyl-ACP methyl ester carboxylesterase
MLERRYLSIDGLRWSFLEQGKPSPDHPTLVMLHGLMGCAQTFAPLMESLGPNLHIVALDLPGSGRSERRSDIDPSLLVTAEQVARVLDALGIVRPVVLGHSHGGAVALSLAARYRDRVRSLMLLAPAHPYFEEGDPLIRFYLSLPGRLFAYTLPWYPQWLQLLGLRRMAGKYSSDTTEQLQPYRENLRIPGTIYHLLRLLKSWKKDFTGLHKALRKPLATPSLIVWGDYDRAVPLQSAPALRERLLHSELVVLRGIGHRPAEETPAAVAHLLQEWLVRDTAAQSIRYSPKLSSSHRRSAALIPSSLEAGD